MGNQRDLHGTPGMMIPIPDPAGTPDERATRKNTVRDRAGTAEVDPAVDRMVGTRVERHSPRVPPSCRVSPLPLLNGITGQAIARRQKTGGTARAKTNRHESNSVVAA
ncbi:hypothetical protein [Methylobacterium sp. Leaf466]|uniref:hypothetical protein n=1 Tax=Methylobacterium sp. Leaf466 TaxID=1736386 RepID=UPI0012E3AEC9|nr:hypothetical protein [Methylobacterium sp. Leaf466]